MPSLLTNIAESAMRRRPTITPDVTAFLEQLRARREFATQAAFKRDQLNLQKAMNVAKAKTQQLQAITQFIGTAMPFFTQAPETEKIRMMQLGGAFGGGDYGRGIDILGQMAMQREKGLQAGTLRPTEKPIGAVGQFDPRRAMPQFAFQPGAQTGQPIPGAMFQAGVEPVLPLTPEEMKAKGLEPKAFDIRGRPTKLQKVGAGEFTLGDFFEFATTGKVSRGAGRDKGPGFLGTLERPGGGVSTEISVGVNIDGQEMEIPTLVPTLTQGEKQHLLAGNKPTQEIINKAVKHAKARIAEGQSPFAQRGEAQPSKFRIEKIVKGGITAGRVPTEVEREAELGRKVKERELLTRAADLARAKVKKETLAAVLDDFFLIDDYIDRGQGFGRLTKGLQTLFKGIEQKDIGGFAAASHDAIVLRLRVQLVRAAGDVGNINIVEQEAAQKMVPTKFDSRGTAQLKRAFLKETVKAIDDKSQSAVRAALQGFMREANRRGIERFPQTELSPIIDFTPEQIEAEIRRRGLQ